MCEKYINVHEAIGENRSLLRHEMWFASIFFAFFNLFFLANSSTCPESKKPHLTSCTIFYSCVNLPGGGYVWVPSRCNKGLVFQPYLRMCVVPGDIWTCDTLATEENVMKYDANEYSGYTENSGLSETIDSSYVIDDFSDPTTEAVTAIPLIEFEESEGTTRGDENVRNVSYHKEENYLYNYMNSQEQMALSLMQKYKNIIDIHQKWLNELMNRLHVYKEMSTAISSSLTFPVKNITIINPTQTVTIFASHNQKQNLSLNYPAQSIDDNNKSQGDKPIETEDNNKLETDNIATTTSSVSTENTLKLLIDSLDVDNNIIRIDDDIGTRKYLTIEDYKTISHRLKPRHISVVMCTMNLRMANKTNCNKYYTCDPKTASLSEYFCPPHTAFNANLRICDIESVKTCGINKYPTTNEIIEREITTKKMQTQESSERKTCKEIGKIKDPSSDSHYYICYNAPGSDEIKSIRMTCPNTLIFCQNKKVCTTKRLCDSSR